MQRMNMSNHTFNEIIEMNAAFNQLTDKSLKYDALMNMSGKLEEYVNEITNDPDLSTEHLDAIFALGSDIHKKFTIFESDLNKNKKDKFYHVNHVYNLGLHSSLMCTILSAYATHEKYNDALVYSAERIELMEKALTLYKKKQHKKETQETILEYRNAHQNLLLDAANDDLSLDDDKSLVSISEEIVDSNVDMDTDVLLNSTDAVTALLALRNNSDDFKIGSIFNALQTIQQNAQSINELFSTLSQTASIAELKGMLKACITALEHCANTHTQENDVSSVLNASTSSINNESITVLEDAAHTNAQENAVSDVLNAASSSSDNGEPSPKRQRTAPQLFIPTINFFPSCSEDAPTHSSQSSKAPSPR